MATKHDLEKLNDENTRTEYMVATENIFQTLLQTANEDQKPDKMFKHIKDIFLSTADKILGKRRNKKDKPWISKETL